MVAVMGSPILTILKDTHTSQQHVGLRHSVLRDQGQSLNLFFQRCLQLMGKPESAPTYLSKMITEHIQRKDKFCNYVRSR